MNSTGFEDHPRRAKPGSDTRYALMLFDGVRILVPQNDVRSVETVMDLQRGTPAKRSVGTVQLGEQGWPVFSINRNLDLLQQVPVEHRVCVLMSTRALRFGLTCNELSTLDGGDVRVVPMPACMRQPHSALRALAILEKRIACIADTGALAGRIQEAARDDVQANDPHLNSQAVF